MNRRIVLIVVAVVLAIFGTVAVYGYAHNADKRAVADGRAVKVLIATKRVPAGTSWADAVKSGNLSVQNVPASSRPVDALSSPMPASPRPRWPRATSHPARSFCAKPSARPRPRPAC